MGNSYEIKNELDCIGNTSQILFGSTTLVFYNKVYVNKIGMDKGIHHMLVDSALFFK